ncbi:BnaCnng57790D [Brassica napus]|nr:unnamed protein product [Brassica napus]CDY68160.1 BnaCnng57790D [Brassica napus]VDC81640.1 unnamed protein product [Brassica rapa]
MVKAQVEVKGKARRGRPPKNLNVSEAPDLHRPWFQEQHLSLTPSTLIGQLSDEALLAVANGRQARQRRQQIRRSKRDKLPQQGKLSTSSKTCN